MKYFFIVLILVHNSVNGQNPGPRLVAMGSGGTAVQDIWALKQNPAGIASFERPRFGMAYERHLFTPDLSTQMALFIIPFRRNVLGFSSERYGIKEYREQQTGLSYARRFGNSFRLGIGVTYHQLTILQYGSAKAFSVQAGFQLNVTEKLIISSHIANPSQSRYQNHSGSNLPLKLSFGALIEFSDRLLMVADVRKLLNYPVDFSTGIEYNLMRWVSLRGGVSINPFKQYTGIGITYNKIQLDIAVTSHPTLGYSPQIALAYEF